MLRYLTLLQILHYFELDCMEMNKLNLMIIFVELTELVSPSMYIFDMQSLFIMNLNTSDITRGRAAAD